MTKRMLQNFGTWINRVLGIMGLKLIKIYPGSFSSIDIWNFNDEFEDIFGKIKNTVGVSKRSLFILYQTLHQASSVAGDIAECGVYKGGSAYLLAEVSSRLAPQKTIYLFDTFKGLPEPNPRYDHSYVKSRYKDTSVEVVKSFLRRFNNYQIYEGLFQDTLHSIADKTFCLVHIDCDLYDSVSTCCQFFYPRLTWGGIMIFDDYGYTIDWPGAKLAVDEYFSDKKEKPIWLPTGQCVMTKL